MVFYALRFQVKHDYREVAMPMMRVFSDRALNAIISSPAISRLAYDILLPVEYLI